MRILAIDPGTLKSAFVIFNPYTEKIETLGLLDNREMSKKLMGLRKQRDLLLVIERIKSQGAMVSDSIFATCAWSGIFMVNFGVGRTVAVSRRTVLSILGISGGGSDSQVRKHVISELRDVRGAKADIWQAAGLALAFAMAPERCKDGGWEFLLPDNGAKEVDIQRDWEYTGNKVRKKKITVKKATVKL